MKILNTVIPEIFYFWPLSADEAVKTEAKTEVKQEKSEEKQNSSNIKPPPEKKLKLIRWHLI